MAENICNVAKVIDYIEEHINDKLDLESVAAAVHYSKYHMHRMFTNTVGLTIHEYVQRRQLTEAAKLLIFSDKSILDIALLAGYEGQQAFSAIFKAMYKQSPKEFREREVFYPLQLKFTLRHEPVRLDSLDDILGSIRFANEDDIPAWMDLVSLVVDGFPCLFEDDYISFLKKSISMKQALIIRDEYTALGIMAFSYETGNIEFLGVHPQYRKKGIARAFLHKAMEELLREREISITTFREGDKADNGSREACRRLGFAESELLMEYGYPTQKFILEGPAKDADNEQNPNDRRN